MLPSLEGTRSQSGGFREKSCPAQVPYMGQDRKLHEVHGPFPSTRQLPEAQFCYLRFAFFGSRKLRSVTNWAFTHVSVNM